MRASKFFVSTLKEAPSDAEVTSQKLMLRAGMIRKVAAGIYSYMPIGLRSIRKVEGIIREEMNRAGAMELTMPMIQPAELWQETGRWEKMGPELLRLKDRHDRDFAMQPTSEEVVTDIARQELKSYRQLPKNFYQIQTKFRDERRPRFGIMRGREFTMKDAYSFDRSEEAAGRSYDTMYAAYMRIFDRLGLEYRAVAADTGAIGGDRSHEFQVIADTGEDAIVYCPDSDYAANIELAEAVSLLPSRASAAMSLEKTPTPGKATCAEVAELLGVPLDTTVKSLVLATDEVDATGTPVGSTVWLLLVRGDHALNEVKAGKLEPLKGGFRFATEAEIVEHFGCRPGYLGPIGLHRLPGSRIPPPCEATAGPLIRSSDSRSDERAADIGSHRCSPGCIDLRGSGLKPSLWRQTAHGVYRAALAECYGNVAVIGISVRPVTVVSSKRSPALSVECRL